jgi:hypothetical protein
LIPRRTLLGRVPIDDQLVDEIERSGLLDVRFSRTRPDATIASDDGNRTIAWLEPSGAIGAILVQDYSNGESRRVPFPFGAVDIENDGATIAIFLRAGR